MYSVTFLKPIFQVKKEKPIEYKDLGDPCSYLDPVELNNVFEREWMKEKKKEKNKQSLINVCIRSTKPYLWFWSIFFYVSGLVINFFPSLVMKTLLLDLEGNTLGILETG